MQEDEDAVSILQGENHTLKNEVEQLKKEIGILRVSGQTE
jgi:hypothetical protein